MLNFDNSSVGTLFTTAISAVAGAMIPLIIALISRRPALQRIVTEQMRTILEQKDSMIEDLQHEVSDLRRQLYDIRRDSEQVIERLKAEHTSLQKYSKELHAQLRSYIKDLKDPTNDGTS